VGAILPYKAMSLNSLHALPPTPKTLVLPRAPAIIFDKGQCHSISTDGEYQTLSLTEARRLILTTPCYLCYAPLLFEKLKIEAHERIQHFDVMELFAFVHPAEFTVPSLHGLCSSLSLPLPTGAEDLLYMLYSITRHLLRALQHEPRLKTEGDPALIAYQMGHYHLPADQRQPWPWAQYILANLNQDPTEIDPAHAKKAFEVHKALPEWEYMPPPPPQTHFPLLAEETKAQLKGFLKTRHAEEREGQMRYSQAISHMFSPPQKEDDLFLVLAEAGTGTGKTLGYLAPATLYAEKNQSPVWISTYTRNLQKQIQSEIAQSYGDYQTKREKFAVRKGRENYLCLLNYEDDLHAARLQISSRDLIKLGFIARYIIKTNAGELIGGDFPGWMVELLGFKNTLGLTDKRGECIYAACPHFKSCFVEKSIHNAAKADVVIANHALIMHQAATAYGFKALPKYYIFDEGHHLFEAADQVFACHFSMREVIDLKRWLLGAETGQNNVYKSRQRGLKRRLEDLVQGDDYLRQKLDAIIAAARLLPDGDWQKRLSEQKSKNSIESFLSAIYEQTQARSDDKQSPYSLETPPYPLNDGMIELIGVVMEQLNALAKPLQALKLALEHKLDEQNKTLDQESKSRLENMISSLTQKTDHLLIGWLNMLDDLRQGKKAADENQNFVDWFEISRLEGKDYDVGFYRHWLDPMRPFAALMKPSTFGMALTSASLRDQQASASDDWQTAFYKAGKAHLISDAQNIKTFSEPSPFDYQAQSEIYVISDVPKDDPKRIAAAMRDLTLVTGGGALMLFTSIQRLKSVYPHLSNALEKEWLELYAQHIHSMGTSTLIDLFKMNENACLMGTDATRDGVDIPGQSLRMVIYDRVPWPRPTLLHKARRNLFGKGYDDTQTRFKLKQAYGRLIRKANDKGVFVMLDNMLPTRLTDAFPPSVEIKRADLKTALSGIEKFLGEQNKHDKRAKP
jgi:ATP-dependent DNA helicase DinG